MTEKPKSITYETVTELPTGFEGEKYTIGNICSCDRFRKFLVGVITEMRIAHELWEKPDGETFTFSIGQIKVKPLINHDLKKSKYKEDWYSTGICTKLTEKDIQGIKEELKEVNTILETL